MGRGPSPGRPRGIRVLTRCAPGLSLERLVKGMVVVWGEHYEIQTRTLGSVARSENWNVHTILIRWVEALRLSLEGDSNAWGIQREKIRRQTSMTTATPSSQFPDADGPDDRTESALRAFVRGEHEALGALWQCMRDGGRLRRGRCRARCRRARWARATAPRRATSAR